MGSPGEKAGNGIFSILFFLTSMTVNFNWTFTLKYNKLFSLTHQLMDYQLINCRAHPNILFPISNIYTMLNKPTAIKIVFLKPCCKITIKYTSVKKNISNQWEENLLSLFNAVVSHMDKLTLSRCHMNR